MSRRSSGLKLVVDPTACSGHGLCAELLPELIELDRWGFPLLDRGEVDPNLLDHAQRAVRACPAAALKLQRRWRGAT